MPDYMQQSFNGGELSPQILGQLDYAKYKTGAALLKNFVCLPHGPIQNRSGTEFIQEVKDSSKYTRLIPFIASIDAAYIIELGEDYARFYKDGERIETQELIRNGSMEEDKYWEDQSTPSSNERSDEQYYDGEYSRKFVTTGAGEGIVSQIQNTYCVAGNDIDFDLWIYPSVTSIHIKVIGWKVAIGPLTLHDADHSGLSSGSWNNITFTESVSFDLIGIIIEIYSTTADPAGTFYVDQVSAKHSYICEAITNYSETDIDDIDYAQSIDTLFLAHSSYQQSELARYYDDAWFFDEYDYYLSIRDANYAWILSGSGTNEYYCISAITGGDPDLYEPFGFYDSNVAKSKGILGSLAAGEWGYGDNDSLGYDTLYYRSISGTDHDTLPLNQLKIKLSPNTWSTYYGYPETVNFYNDRLSWARGENIYLSRTSIYNDHTYSDDALDDDALDLRLGDGQLSQILYLRSFKGLSLLAANSEWLVTGSDGTSIVTPSSKYARTGSNSGSERVRPVIINDVIIHCLKHSKALKELMYDYDSDSFVGDELTILAEHLTRIYNITEMAFQRTPYKILWCVRSDGTLLGLTYYQRHQVFAWHKHEIAGNGIVESIAVIPGTSSDELWMIVRRTIDGSTVRYIERLKDFFIRPDHGQDYFMDDDTTDAVFMDSSITIDNRIDINSISSANPAIINITNLSSIYGNGDMIRIRNVVGCLDDDGESGVNGFDFTLANISGNTAELQYEEEDFDSTVLTAYVSGGSSAWKIDTVNGLDHLEGEEVTILGDGMQLTNQTVNGGEIELDEYASVIHIGLGYNADYESLTPRIEYQNKGMMTAYAKQITAIMLRLFESTGLSYGPDEDNLIDIEWIDDDVPTGHPAPLYDGDSEEFSFQDGYKKSPIVFIRQPYPLPATISAILMDIEVSNG